MNYSQFSILYDEACTYDDFDMFVAERGWQEWMDKYVSQNEDSEDTTVIVNVLTKIYDFAKGDIRSIRKSTGKSMKAFAKLYDIPERTLQDWEYGKNRMPEYTKKLIVYTMIEDVTGDVNE